MMASTYGVDEVGLMINPNAKGARVALAQRSSFWGRHFNDSLLEVPPDVASIPRALERLQRKGVRVLAMLGGDGTIQQTVTAANKIWGAEQRPAALILKGGTANALAKNMGIRSKPGDLLRTYLARVSQGRTDGIQIHDVPMLEVEDGFDHTIRHGFIFAGGLVYESIRRYRESKNPGPLEIFKQAAYPLWARWFDRDGGKDYFKSPRMTIDIDGRIHIDDPIHVLTLSTLQKLTLWYAPFSGDISSTNRFYGMVNHQDADEAFAHFFDLALGRKDMPRNVNGLFEEVCIETTAGYVLDGELYARSQPYRVRITRGPSLRVLTLTGI